MIYSVDGYLIDLLHVQGIPPMSNGGYGCTSSLSVIISGQLVVVKSAPYKDLKAAYRDLVTAWTQTRNSHA